MVNSQTIKIANDLGKIQGVRDSIAEFVGNVFSPLELNRLILAVDEAVSNIIEHGVPRNADDDGSISLEMHQYSDRFVFILDDHCEMFDPMTVQRPDLDRHINEGRRGGLGVFLYTTLTEARHEELPEGGNRLILIKRISS